MKNSILVVLLALSSELFAQGKFAPPEWKALIGKTFNTESEIPGLAGYQSRGGTMITAVDDPQPQSVSWFSKANSVLVFFEQADSLQKKFTIIDVLEIKNTTATQEIKAGECRDGQSENTGIVALVESSSTKRVRAIKAWLFNRDKLRIEAWSSQKVTCLGIVVTTETGTNYRWQACLTKLWRRQVAGLIRAGLTPGPSPEERRGVS